MNCHICEQPPHPRNACLSTDLITVVEKQHRDIAYFKRGEHPLRNRLINALGGGDYTQSMEELIEQVRLRTVEAVSSGDTVQALSALDAKHVERITVLEKNLRLLREQRDDVQQGLRDMLPSLEWGTTNAMLEAVADRKPQDPTHWLELRKQIENAKQKLRKMVPYVPDATASLDELVGMADQHLIKRFNEATEALAKVEAAEQCEADLREGIREVLDQ